MKKRRVMLIVVGAALGLAVLAAVAVFSQFGIGRSGLPIIADQGAVSSSPEMSSSEVAQDNGSSTGAAGPATGDAKAMAAAPYAAESQGTPAASGIDRQIIRTGAVTMTVKKVLASVESLRSLVTSSGGEIASLTYSAGSEQPVPLDAQASSGAITRGPQSATIVIRLPVAKLEGLARAVAGLGEVTAQTAGQEDVTAQVVDLEARLTNLRAEEVRLRSFLDKAVRVSDMLSIERELSRVRGEIEVMQAQRRYLADQVAMATLTVTMSQPAPVVSPAGADWGFATAVTRGVQTAASLVRGAIVLIIALTPAIAAILLAWVLVALWRRMRPRGPATPVAQAAGKDMME